MGTERVLTVIAKAVAAVALAVQYLMPIGWMLSIHFGDRILVLPARWVAPLLLISIAGGVSSLALGSMYWRHAHFTITSAGQ